MRCEGLTVTASAAVLGERTPVDARVRAAHPAPVDLDAQELSAVSRSERTALEVAAQAARVAWARHPGRHADREVALVLATTGRMGPRLWSAPAWVGGGTAGADRLRHCETVNALCAGGVHALATAARLLMTEAHLDSAVVVSGDTASDMGADRWAFDGGVTLGDGAGAVVVGRTSHEVAEEDGGWTLLSVSEGAHAGFEFLQRGDSPPDTADPDEGAPTRYRDLLRLACAHRDVDVAQLRSRHASLVSGTVDRALAEAGIDRSQVRHWALPFVGRDALRVGYLEPLGIAESASTSALGRSTGHLGGADALVALDRLDATRAAPSGTHVALVGVGSGQTCSVAILLRA